jgi:flagellar biosynthesis chaperone FliJ
MNRCDDFRRMANRSVVVTYRVFAITSLYSVLAGVLVYALLMGFYAVNRSWIAPVILSPSDRESLELTQKLVTSTATLEDLRLDLDRQQKNLAEMRTHKAQLQALQPALAAAIARERAHDRANGPELETVWQQKRAANLRTLTLDQQVSGLESTIDQELAAGLITKSDAALGKAQLNQTHMALVDSKVGEVLLRDSVLQKNNTGTQVLEILDKQAELASQIAQLDISIGVAETQVQTESMQIERLSKAIATAADNPYYLTATGSSVPLALVPYDNQSELTAGVPVFDCYLNMLVCRRVGTVKQVFAGEQHATHPIFRTDLRGFLIQLQLEDPDSAKSKVLFLGHKPLWL